MAGGRCRALNLRGRGHGGPWTTQKVLHLLVTLCAAARCAFFAHASTLWDWEAGTVSTFATPAPRLAFYVLDQLPTTVLFTIYASVALFWAEMVFVATDGALLYEDYARPADAVVNAATYALLVLQWAAWLIGATPSTCPGPYALVSAALYATAAALLVGFGRAAAYELRRVPIEGVLRRKKLREIGALTSAGAFATLGRSVALLAVRDRPLPLDGPWDALVAAGYFGLLELAPVLPCCTAAGSRGRAGRTARGALPAQGRGPRRAGRAGAWPSSSSNRRAGGRGRELFCV